MMLEEDLHPLKTIDLGSNRSQILKGYLFVFEGPDGCGKTTILNDVGNIIEAWNYPVERLREPTGDTKDAQIAMKIIHDPDFDVCDPEVKAKLRKYFEADRDHDIQRHIKPALDRGDIVLMDRYFHSSAVYQGDPTFPMDAILDHARNDEGAPEPCITFVLTHLPAILQQRIRARDELDRRDPYLMKIPQIIKDYEHLMIYDHEGCYVQLFNDNRQLTALTIANIIRLVVSGSN